MANTIKIFDTTLRDGEQTPLVNLNIHEKVEIAKQLEKLGVDVIEAGFAISSPGDFKAVRAVAKEIKHARVASLSRALPKDIDTAWEAVKETAFPRIHTFIATSDIHMKYKLKMDENEVLERAVAMVKYAKAYCEDIEFSAEDASRSSIEFLYRVIQEVIKAGATVVNIPDTVGYATPLEFGRLIAGIKENVSGIHKVDISVHCHNDLGLAVANSMAAIENGATQVECTINGIGERAGNAALEEIIMGLHTRSDYYAIGHNIETTQIYRTSKLVSSLTGINVQPNKAVIGANAFAHESGIHQHGVLSEKKTYEIMTPESVGIASNKMVLGKLSGRHAFEDRLKELGYGELQAGEVTKAFEKFKMMADKKKSISDRDIEALIEEHSSEVPHFFELINFQIINGRNLLSTATVEILKGEERIVEASIGDGPVDAAFNALEKATRVGLNLEEYTLKSVTEGKDALGEVTVKVSKNHVTYVGKSVNTDIIEASVEAYIHAINRVISELGEDMAKRV
jgi:2-isopropylmalate synthase